MQQARTKSKKCDGCAKVGPDVERTINPLLENKKLCPACRIDMLVKELREVKVV